MRNTILISVVAVGIICAALISYGMFTQRDGIPLKDLSLSEYPKLFAEETVIVIGENAFRPQKFAFCCLYDSKEAKYLARKKLIPEKLL